MKIITIEHTVHNLHNRPCFSSLHEENVDSEK